MDGNGHVSALPFLSLGGEKPLQPGLNHEAQYIVLNAVY